MSIRAGYGVAILSIISPLVGFAQCTSPYISTFWWWNDPQYAYSGSLNVSDINSSASAWSGLVSQNGFSLTPMTEYDDIQMGDDYSIADLAQTTVYSQAFDSGCYGYADMCGVCYNNQMVFYATVVFNPTRIYNTANTLHLVNPNVTMDTETILTASHEFGHVFALGDFYGTLSNCSSTTVMYYGSGPDERCNIFYPQQYCDGGLFNTWYSYNGVDPEIFDYCKTGGCRAGGFCGYGY